MADGSLASLLFSRLLVQLNEKEKEYQELLRNSVQSRQEKIDALKIKTVSKSSGNTSLIYASSRLSLFSGAKVFISHSCHVFFNVVASSPSYIYCPIYLPSKDCSYLKCVSEVRYLIHPHLEHSCLLMHVYSSDLNRYCHNH